MTRPAPTRLRCWLPFVPRASRWVTRLTAALGRTKPGARSIGSPLRIQPALLTLLTACLVTTQAHSTHVGCSEAEVSVISATAEDTDDVCEAATRVFSFFRQMGLHKTVPLVVSTVARMVDETGYEILGDFAPDTRSIRMLTFDAAKRRGSWLGRPVDRMLYRSLAAHEIAHALAWCNTSIGPLSVRAREYVAYAVTFETMELALREAILAEMPGPGFEREREISDTYYLLAPARFGVGAYRHYIRPENGHRFLREILRGSALMLTNE